MTGLAIYTLFHVAISLIAIVLGFVITYAFLISQRSNRANAAFLIFTVATSITGFLFPYHGFTPGIAVGILSIIILSIAIFARYAKKMSHAWRWIYVVTAMIAFYFNFFVLVAQSFEKIPALHDLAPTQSEPPFKFAQLAVLVIFATITIIAAIKFHPDPQMPEGEVATL
jgi:uncharacterized membrane protein